MALAVAHTTPAFSDVTSPLFSPAGISAWDGTGAHTLTGIASSAQGGTGNAFFGVTGPTTTTRTFTFPDADATVAHGVVGANVIPLGSATGAISASSITYSATSTGVTGGGTLQRPMFTTTTGGLGVEFTRTTTTGTMAVLNSALIVNPAGDQASTDSNTGIKVRVLQKDTATHSVGVMTGADLYVSSEDGATLGGVAMAGASPRAEVNSSTAWSAGIIGSTNTAMLRKAGSSAANVIGAQSDMDDAGTATLLGAATNFYGYKINGMNLTASFTATNRAALRIDTMTGAAATDDYAIDCQSALPSRHVGKLALGGSFNPSYVLSFVKEAAAQISVEKSVAGAVGAGLTVTGGDASTTTTNNRAGGSLTLAPGAPTGSNASTVAQVVTYTVGSSGTTAQTPVVAQAWGANGKTTTFAGLTTVGMGLATVLKDGQSATINTATTTTLQDLTPAAAIGRYMVMACFTTDSNTNNGTVKITVDYVDSQGTTHTADILPASDATGAMDADGVITVAASKEYFFGPRMISTDASAGHIIVKAVTTATISGKGSADIVRYG